MWGRQKKQIFAFNFILLTHATLLKLIPGFIDLVSKHLILKALQSSGHLQLTLERANAIFLACCFIPSCIFLQVFITNGWMSDVVIVVAVTNREARTPAHGISLFLVENGTKGFIKGRKLNKIGLKAQVRSYHP